MKNSIAVIFSLAITFLSTHSLAADGEIASMLKEYERNQARFYAMYKDKRIEKTGVVQSIIAENATERKINSLTNLPPIFLISISVSGSKVSCFLSDEKIAVKLNEKDAVKFTGTINDITLSGDGIMVSNCKISPK